MVRSVKFTNGQKIKCDLVVLCNGPEAPYHMAKTLNTILPSL